MEWSQIYTSMTSPLVPFKGPSIVHYIYCTLQESAAMFLMMKNPVGLCNPFASVMSVVNMHFNIQGPYGIYLTTLKGSLSTNVHCVLELKWYLIICWP